MMTKDLNKAFERVDEYLRKTMDACGLPGLSLGVTDRQGILRLSTLGLADIGSQTPVTSGTLFEIGSISKSFASVVTLQLAEEGKLDLHAPVTNYLPWLSIKSKHDPITLHHLLCHTSGIIMGTEITGFATAEAFFLEEFETGSPPGSFFWYSNTGYKLVGLVIERITGVSNGDAIADRVLRPLGMTKTLTQITDVMRDGLATGYSPRYGDRPREEGSHLAHATWMESDTADGSISSTAEDMCAYMRMLMNHGAAGVTGRVLSQDSFKLLISRAIRPEEGAPGESYGYGLSVFDEDHVRVGHTGGMIGFTSGMMMDMDLGLGVIVLTNGQGDIGTIAKTVLTALRDELEGRGKGPLFIDAGIIEAASKYEGVYKAGDRILRLRAEGNRLLLATEKGEVPLTKRANDGFYVPDREYARFLLKFDERDGRVSGVMHGPDYYFSSETERPAAVKHPRSWKAFEGHYRTYNPWVSNFRVVLRRGELLMIEPSGHEEPLVSLGGRVFRIGRDERIPERLRFDQIVEGRALEANLSGCPCFRTFTP